MTARKHRKRAARVPKPESRRRWIVTSTSSIPAGPAGQPEHPAGTSFSVVLVINWPDRGRVSFSVPRPSALLLEVGSAHLEVAADLRPTLSQHMTDKGFIKPFSQWTFTNEAVLYEFFQEAMAGIVLTHAALDNFASESIPSGFVLTDGTEALDRAQLEQKGILFRLSRALSTALGKPNIMTDRPDLWERVLHLKGLRDEIAHVRDPNTYSIEEADTTTFAKLIREGLEAPVRTVNDVIDHYGLGH
jgi:hypothetical protein